MKKYNKTQINKILKNTEYNDFIDFVKKDSISKYELTNLLIK